MKSLIIACIMLAGCIFIAAAFVYADNGTSSATLIVPISPMITGTSLPSVTITIPVPIVSVAEAPLTVVTPTPIESGQMATPSPEDISPEVTETSTPAPTAASSSKNPSNTPSSSSPNPTVIVQAAATQTTPTPTPKPVLAPITDAGKTIYSAFIQFPQSFFAHPQDLQYYKSAGLSKKENTILLIIASILFLSGIVLLTPKSLLKITL